MPLETKLPASIPIPVSAVVMVIDYAEAEEMYQFILAHKELPAVFQKFATALDHPDLD